MADEYYDSVVKSIHEEATKRRSKESLMWDVVEGTAAVIDASAGTDFSKDVKTGKKILNKARGKSDPGLVPNPWFVVNGHEDGSTSYSKKYMKHSKAMKKRSSRFSAASGALSTVTQVNIGGIAKHGNATGSTIAHIHQLRSIASSYRQSRTLIGWFDLLIRMKAIKLVSRGGQLVGAAVPLGGVSLGVDIAKAGIDMGVKLTHTKTCLATAADIHWRAYQEQAISGGLKLGSGAVGPASRMMYEIFKQRGFTKIFGQHDVDKIIKDPAGWLVLNDKLMQI
ncbi:MAG: hypothetical protein CMI02_09045 [Oceanospirillaceae bacterium]|nr:hypothetical protein [Oceanospirillaceae bacterium]MBT12168.1 hypothetical protein [Oceanospirillaceae bacterium]|tara:strand:- start:94007 stop:94849 length:843 start_codon:yes stop_codon:yes gene_type:complete